MEGTALWKAKGLENLGNWMHSGWAFDSSTLRHFMKTKVYKIEVLIVDHDRVGAEEIRSVIENAHYPNRCIMPRVMEMREREVEWTDEHPLNKRSTASETYKELFKPLVTQI